MTEGYEQYTQQPDPEKLSQLSKLAGRMAVAEKEVLRLQEELKKATEAYRALAESDIPDLMDEVGIARYTTTEGYGIDLTRKLRVSVPRERRARAMAWLRTHGHDAIIKSTVSVSLGKGQTEETRKAAEALREQAGLEPLVESKVEPSTLRAFIREQLEVGNEIPMDLFGAFEQRIAKVVHKE